MRPFISLGFRVAKLKIMLTGKKREASQINIDEPNKKRQKLCDLSNNVSNGTTNSNDIKPTNDNNNDSNNDSKSSGKMDINGDKMDNKIHDTITNKSPSMNNENMEVNGDDNAKLESKKDNFDINVDDINVDDGTILESNNVDNNNGDSNEVTNGSNDDMNIERNNVDVYDFEKNIDTDQIYFSCNATSDHSSDGDRSPSDNDLYRSDSNLYYDGIKYFPDVIENLEHLIPYHEINPFFTANITDSNDSFNVGKHTPIISEYNSESDSDNNMDNIEKKALLTKLVTMSKELKDNQKKFIKSLNDDSKDNDIKINDTNNMDICEDKKSETKNDENKNTNQNDNNNDNNNDNDMDMDMDSNPKIELEGGGPPMNGGTNDNHDTNTDEDIDLNGHTNSNVDINNETIKVDISDNDDDYHDIMDDDDDMDATNIISYNDNNTNANNNNGGVIELMSSSEEEPQPSMYNIVYMEYSFDINSIYYFR